MEKYSPGDPGYISGSFAPYCDTLAAELPRRQHFGHGAPVQAPARGEGGTLRGGWQEPVIPNGGAVPSLGRVGA